MTDQILARLGRLDVATVHEAAGRRGELNPAIRPIQQGVSVAGRAVTARACVGDNLAIHRAVLAAKPGDVLVAAVDGHLAGYWGELLAVAAQARGIAGLVIDGGCRDTAALRRRGFPVWSRGISVTGTRKLDAGEVNVPIAVGGVVVASGDYVLADDDGVVCVPAKRIDEVLDAAEARVAKEEAIMDGLANGGTTIDLLGLGSAVSG